MEFETVTLRREQVRIGEVVASVVDIIAPRAARAGVAVSAQMPADLTLVSADRDRLAQVLINLIDNAVKYTPDGGSVTVTGRNLEPGRIEVAVADTGIGIPPADLPRITQRFYRFAKARSRELGGTGLGLAIVNHLAMAHRGELSIQSHHERV